MKMVVFIIMLMASNCWGVEEFPEVVDRKVFNSPMGIYKIYNDEKEIIEELKYYNGHQNKINQERFCLILKVCGNEDILLINSNIIKLFLSIYYANNFNEPLIQVFNREINTAREFIKRVIVECRPEDLKSYNGEKVGSISEDKIETIATHVNRLHDICFNKWWNSKWYIRFKATNSVLEEILYKILTSRRETCVDVPMNISNAGSITMASLMPRWPINIREIDGSRNPQPVHSPTNIDIYDESNYYFLSGHSGSISTYSAIFRPR